MGEIRNVTAGEGELPAALTDTDASGPRSGRYLADGPAIAVIDDDETVQFVLTNRQQGIAVQRGTTRHVLPDSGYQTVVVVTDRRVLALVGTEDGDRRFSLDIPEITAVATATERRTGRLTIDGADGTTVAIHTGTDGLAAVAAYLRRESGACRTTGRVRSATRSLRGLLDATVGSVRSFQRERVADLLPALARSARGGSATDAGDTAASTAAASSSSGDRAREPTQQYDEAERERAIDDILQALAKTDWRARGGPPESPFDLLAQRADELVGVVVHCPADGRVDHSTLRRCEAIAGAAGTDSVMLATTADARAGDARLAAELGVRLRSVESMRDTTDPPTIAAVTEMVRTVLQTGGWTVRPSAPGPFDLLAESGTALLGVVVHGPEDGPVRRGIERCDAVSGAAGTDTVMLATTGTVRDADERLADELGVRLVEADSLAHRHVTAVGSE